MFGNNKDTITSEQLDDLMKPLLERVDKLETVVQKQAKQLAALQRVVEQYEARQQEEPHVEAETPATPLAEEGRDMLEVGDTISLEVPPAAMEETLYLPAPTPDGWFPEGSASLQVGKSIYRLRSVDGVNGYFSMLTSPDALATALISVSQFVKPACRIEGDTHRLPQRVETLEEGTAQRDGNAWRVVRKATVRFV